MAGVDELFEVRNQVRTAANRCQVAVDVGVGVGVGVAVERERGSRRRRKTRWPYATWKDAT